MLITNELLRKCKLKEGLAQKQLYGLLLPYLNVVCNRYLNNSTDVKDTLQETFINIFLNIDKYDSSRGQFKTWAVKICINCCLKCNHKVVKLNTKQFILEQHNRSINPEILAKLSDEDLLIFLKKMPQACFEVFNLHVIDGFSHKEIASLLKIKESLSRKRLSRAREWLSSKRELKVELSHLI